jgi:hypothetical protein
VIVIHTDAPLIPLTQMVAGDGMIDFSSENQGVLTVSVEDPLVAYWVTRTLDALGYQTEVVTQTGV